MRVIIVDDEPAAIIVLSSLLSAYEEIDIVGSYTNPMEALEEIKMVQPDVVFLDIEMGKVNGLEIADLFSQQAVLDIVFVTAYSQYAVDAFEVNAMDYLLKPVQKRRLDKTIQRLKGRILENSVEDKGRNPVEQSLDITSLGRFQVFNHYGEQVNWRTQKTKELLAYLWVHNESLVNKSVIMEVIFPDRDLTSAKTLLHTTIYQLRKSLERLGFSNGIVYSNESYKLQVPIKSDIEVLNSILESDTHTQEEIKDILRIYKGDFLAEEGYCWSTGIQEGLRRFVLDALEVYALNQIENRNMTPLLGDCLSLMYKIDPFSDTVAKMIIEYYGTQGKRDELKKFFHGYKEELWYEMELKPTKSIIELYENYSKSKQYI